MYHKKIVRDRAMFDDNQIDSTALEDFLSIVATEDFVAEGDKVKEIVYDSSHNAYKRDVDISGIYSFLFPLSFHLLMWHIFQTRIWREKL